MQRERAWREGEPFRLLRAAEALPMTTIAEQRARRKAIRAARKAAGARRREALRRNSSMPDPITEAWQREVAQISNGCEASVYIVRAFHHYHSSRG